MKKVLFIGDIHGRGTWKELAKDALRHFQDIVFLGDYVDSFDIKPLTIASNFREIIRFKQKYPDRVTLLLGNHDYAYIDERVHTSGYTHYIANDYQSMFREHRELFQPAWGYTNIDTGKYTLATHAGLTYSYYKKYLLSLIEYDESVLNKLTDGKAIDMPLHEIINYLRDDGILWKVGPVRGGVGIPGPLWADQTELIADRYPGINQIFGHSASGGLTITELDGDLLIKVDGWAGKTVEHITVTL